MLRLQVNILAFGLKMKMLIKIIKTVLMKIATVSSRVLWSYDGRFGINDGGGGGRLESTSTCSDFHLHLCFARAQTFAMVDGHYGTVVDGVFTSADYGRGYASSGPVFIGSLLRGTCKEIRCRGV